MENSLTFNAFNMAIITEVDADLAHDQAVAQCYLGEMLEVIEEMERKFDGPSGELDVVCLSAPAEVIQLSPGIVQINCRDEATALLGRIESQLGTRGRFRCYPCQRFYNRAFIPRVWHLLRHRHWPVFSVLAGME